MNRQAVYADVYTHLEQQGFERCYRDMCLYRDEKRKSSSGKTFACGIGGIIPDSLYSKAIEGTGVDSLVRERSITLEESTNFEPVAAAIGRYLVARYGALGEDDDSFLTELQRVHDQSENGPADMKARLSEFAEIWGLTVPGV